MKRNLQLMSIVLYTIFIVLIVLGMILLILFNTIGIYSLLVCATINIFIGIGSGILATVLDIIRFIIK